MLVVLDARDLAAPSDWNVGRQPLAKTDDRKLRRILRENLSQQETDQRLPIQLYLETDAIRTTR
jgi:hypothetical protein